jgi:Cys-tRNA synthase (O-phospho-L-seryl-tRNA:Cys-tRNA synthase)
MDKGTHAAQVEYQVEYNVVTQCTQSGKVDEMKRVGIREFREHASQYLAGDEVVAVERHGKALGFYLPVPHSKTEDAQQSLIALRDAVAHALSTTGLSEDALADLFDLRRPLP